jgi:hypothetical protein
VTINNTWVRIGYRIYSLWRFTAAADYNYNKHLALVAPWDPTDGTALRRRLTNFFRCRRVTNCRLLPSQWKHSTMVAIQPCNATIRAYPCKCLTFGCIATTGVSNFRLHSNGGIRPNTSHYETQMGFQLATQRYISQDRIYLSLVRSS